MGKFSIDSEMIKKEKEQIDVLREKSQGCTEKLRVVASDFGSFCRDAANEKISSKLNQIMERVISQAAQLDSLGEALGYIADAYENLDLYLKDIPADVEGNIESNYENTIGKDKRSGWTKFWDWLFKKKVDTRYTHTEDEQEKAADNEMKSQIQNLICSREKYTEHYWDNATIDERKKLLNDFLKDVKQIMGLEVVYGNIKWINNPPDNKGLLTMGYYTDRMRRVTINEYVISNWSSSRSYDLYTTIVHELRHAYQHEAISHPTKYRVSMETINSWKESFRTYERDSADYDSYRNIVVEQDARRFANQE